MSRIIFMGTPEFAVPSLEAMAENHDVVAVFSQPPKPRGRGMKTKPAPAHSRAEALGISVETPPRFDTAEAEKIKALAPDFLVVVAYGLILPPPVLALPAIAAINGHASLLPRWRGAAPIHRAIAAGDKVTGATAMLMEENLDSGPVLCRREEAIRGDDTAASLHDRLALLTAEVLSHTVANYPALTPTPQNEADVTWAEKITPAEAQIDFSLPADAIERRIRAFSPNPGAWFSFPRDDGTPQRIKVLAAEETAASGEAGDVLPGSAGGGPVIAAGTGAITLLQVQPQGKPVMDGAAFLNGNRLPQKISRTKEG